MVEPIDVLGILNNNGTDQQNMQNTQDLMERLTQMEGVDSDLFPTDVIQQQSKFYYEYSLQFKQCTNGYK